MNCCQCGGPWHEATGHVHQREPLVVLCGRCARLFYKWYRARMAMMNRPHRGDTVSFAMAAATSNIPPR